MPGSPKAARPFLVLAYVLLAGAGATAMIWPSPSIGQAGRALADFWASFLVVGGLLCAIGAARRTWFGEYIGLPLLIVVWLIYGIAAGYAALASRGPSSWAAALALLAVASLLAYRWEYVAVYRKAARQNAERADRPPEEGT